MQNISEGIRLNHFDLFVFIIEIISITSFAVSGSITAIKKGLDTFGVVIVGVTTSIGGGILRDIILGITLPKTFTNPIYAAVAAVISLLTFIIEYRHAKKLGEEIKSNKFTEAVMFWLDTLGLGIFTMVGVATAYEISNEFSGFLLCFVGVITGVGGGIMRDIFVGNRPYIFVKHFYASTCIIGSIVCIILWNICGRVISMLVGATVIVVLRFFAAKYRWNMPHVPGYDYK
ncbi:MAG: trimeric intracellular cation channel family protein [Ruminococcaceae bacterium]|nr:trimeric intracellular cation channel family protein [Oscillospiraceae bacterium]